MSKLRYELANGGFVYIDWLNDIQSVQPKHENTLVILNNGVSYLLRGRTYGV